MQELQYRWLSTLHLYLVLYLGRFLHISDSSGQQKKWMKYSKCLHQNCIHVQKYNRCSCCLSTPCILSMQTNMLDNQSFIWHLMTQAITPQYTFSLSSWSSLHWLTNILWFHLGVCPSITYTYVWFEVPSSPNWECLNAGSRSVPLSFRSCQSAEPCLSDITGHFTICIRDS